MKHNQARFHLNQYPTGDRILTAELLLVPGLGWAFRRLLPEADAVYLPTGDSPSLILALQDSGITLEDFLGKDVYAISAGVSALTTYSFNFDHLKVVKGLGILPYSSIVHYTVSKLWASEYLEFKYKLPVLAIFDDSEFDIVLDDKGKVISTHRHLKEPVVLLNNAASPPNRQ